MYSCQMTDVIDVRNVIYVMYDIYDMYGALTYTICMYVHLGVKRSVRTSGMQSTILNILKKSKYSMITFEFNNFFIVLVLSK